jgi:glycosyltransferase involved in cell wall biosynthesis
MKASVAVFTYNHASFIEQAIDSVLAQETGFEFELVIGDDASTDGTREILRRYRERYPAKIRLLRNERNLGAVANFKRTIEACRGQYVATLDGDDYWTYAGKLRRQVRFLDAHLGCTVCFHSAMMVWEDGAHQPVLHRPPGRRARYGLEDLLVRDFISTGSALVRRAAVPDLPEWWASVPVFDWPYFVLHALAGSIGYIDECWSVYRQHGDGVYSALPRERQMEQNIAMIERFRVLLGPVHKPLLTRALSSRYLSLALHQQAQGSRANAKRAAQRAVQEGSLGWTSRWRTRLKVLVYMNVPGLYGFMARRRAASRG